MKLGIVMEGGASRTIFSCGVTEALMEEEIYPDYLIGVSAGIAYGVSYASRQRGRNREFTMKYMHTRKYMGLHHWLNPKKRCYYNLEFAFDEIPNRLVPYDYEALANYPGRVVAVVTDIESGEAEYFDIPPYETHWETSIASCALPVLFPSVRLGDKLYLDGGIADPVPYKKALAEGCDKVLVILTRERGYQKSGERGMRIVRFAYRKYPNIIRLMNERTKNYNRLTEELFLAEREGKVFIIAPDDTFGVGRTEGDWERLEPLYEEGIRIGREQLKAFREYLKTG